MVTEDIFKLKLLNGDRNWQVTPLPVETSLRNPVVVKR